MVARGCEDDLSVAESRIKASANFFGPSCKPGPWVADAEEDAILSKKINYYLFLFLSLSLFLVINVVFFSASCAEQQSESIQSCAKYAIIRSVAANWISTGAASGRCTA